MTPEEFLAKPTTKYSDWFGEDDSHSDYKQYVGQGEPPLNVYQDNHMLCLEWKDKIVVTGYDGGEYCHTFEFNK